MDTRDHCRRPALVLLPMHHLSHDRFTCTIHTSLLTWVLTTGIVLTLNCLSLCFCRLLETNGQTENAAQQREIVRWDIDFGFCIERSLARAVQVPVLTGVKKSCFILTVFPFMYQLFHFSATFLIQRLMLATLQVAGRVHKELYCPAVGTSRSRSIFAQLLDMQPYNGYTLSRQSGSVWEIDSSVLCSPHVSSGLLLHHLGSARERETLVDRLRIRPLTWYIQRVMCGLSIIVTSPKDVLCRVEERSSLSFQISHRAQHDEGS